LNKKIDAITQIGNSHQSKQQQVKLSPLNQLCPKLDEIPLIEPLICKRVANERLTGLIFKEDCFLIASQDGIVNTWTRPDKVIGHFEILFERIRLKIVIEFEEQQQNHHRKRCFD
jgi:hypothetical protein